MKYSGGEKKELKNYLKRVFKFYLVCKICENSNNKSPFPSTQTVDKVFIVLGNPDKFNYNTFLN